MYQKILGRKPIWVKEEDIIDIIAKNPEIQNNTIAYKLGYIFDLRRCRGWFTRNIVNLLIADGIVVRPAGQTACWIAEGNPGRRLEGRRIEISEMDIIDVIGRNPKIQNNDIARELDYHFDLGNQHRGRLVRKIVDTLVEDGIVMRPRPGQTHCWLSEDSHKKWREIMPEA